MKKLAFLLIFIANLLFANSPSALANLTVEHKAVNPTHAIQLQTIINKKELEKFILLSKSNFLFELNKYKTLLYNHAVIIYQKGFYNAGKSK
ncbi:hypothetical protein KDE13_09175 [Campylobacter sp. faydin G-140]|uniref:hypothetical protein n=1 Tax=Campylobacter anatolicus TaxID=2829105 RepID=UPI001B9619C9|nr:hypothetical protein [Campylobacter anatolicus]MBR8466504.1 hypothetical protein [Campylobacter anatolicus]